MVDLAFRGTEHDFAKLAVTDFGGGSQFYAWAAAILVLGALGYVPGLRKTSSALLALVIVVLVLVHGGAFTTLAGVITHPPTPVPSIPLSDYKNPTTSGSSKGGGSGGGSGGGGGSSSSSSSSDVQTGVQAAGEAISIASLFA